MTVLGIDCSSTIMSVSLKENERLFEFSIQDGFKNSEYLMPLIDKAFEISSIKSDSLDLITVASGPGSFTGLRIAMSTAKGISFGSSAPIKSVSTLEAYSMGHDLFDGVVVPVIDARKKRFYAAAFQKGKRLFEDSDISAEDLLKSLEKFNSILFTGPDSNLFSSFAENDTRIKLDGNFTSNSATNIIKLGMRNFEINGPDSSGTGPVYLRKSEAEISMFGE